MSTFAVDASVAAKWILRQEVHAAAALRLSLGHVLIAPELCLAELTNILWKQIRRGVLTVDEATEALESTKDAVSFLSAVDISEASPQLALLSGVSAYDAIYAQLAIREDCQLVTADRKLYNALAPAFPETMLWVEDVPGTDDAPA